MECSEFNKSPNPTVKIHNNTALCVCVVDSMFGVGRLKVIKQQDLCSDRFVSTIHLKNNPCFC